MFINVVVINVYVLWLYYLNHLAAKCVNKIYAILSVMCEIHQLFCNLHEPWGKGYTLHLSLAAINIYCPYCHKKLVIIFWHYFVTDLLQLGKCKGSFKWWLSDILGMPYRSSNYISWQILDIFDLFIKITSSNILHYFRKMHLRSLHHWYSIL